MAHSMNMIIILCNDFSPPQEQVRSVNSGITVLTPSSRYISCIFPSCTHHSPVHNSQFSQSSQVGHDGQFSQFSRVGHNNQLSSSVSFLRWVTTVRDVISVGSVSFLEWVTTVSSASSVSSLERVTTVSSVPSVFSSGSSQQSANPVSSVSFPKWVTTATSVQSVSCAPRIVVVS